MRTWLRSLALASGFVIAYFCLLLVVQNRAMARVGRPSPVLRSLSPVASFARVSAPRDADEGEFVHWSPFLARFFDPSREITFSEVGRDSGGQPLRGHPSSVAVSRDGTKLYVTLPGNESEPLDRVAVVDAENGNLLKVVRVGISPFAATLHPRNDLLFVTHLYSNFISIIDTTRDAEVARVPLVTPAGARFYAQKIAFVRAGEQLLVTNRMTDSLLVYEVDRLSLRFLAEIPLSVSNHPIDSGDEPPSGPYNISSDADHLDPSIDGLTANSNPRELVRNLTNVNPRDVVVFENVWLRPGHLTDLAYVGHVNGLGVSIVDLRAGEQIGAIDLNSPAMGLAKDETTVSFRGTQRRLLFIATGSRFAGGLADIVAEIAVVSVDVDPRSLSVRYTSSPQLPVGPNGGPGTGVPVPPTADAPYLSAFATTTGVRGGDNPNSARDRLPELLGGALPFQLAAVDGFLSVIYAASDQLELFSINRLPRTPTDVLARKSIRYTNSGQVAFPTTRLQTLLETNFNQQGLLDYPVYINGSLTSGDVGAAEPVTGEREPGFFDGRHPSAVAVHAPTRRIYVATRLGESVAAFEYSDEGFLVPARLAVFDLRSAVATAPAPRFPATLAEMGEDFYTSARVTLNRRQACLSCHPDTNTDSKSWAVSAAPGNVRRRVQTNRNLRDTAPYGFAGSRSNLEICARNLRSFAADSFFGASLMPDHHAFRDANGDGRKDLHDWGRPQADVNRDAMYVLERAGVGFEYVSAAIAAFLEVEPRILPNPFREAGGSLSAAVPMNLGGNVLRAGNARRGEQLFRELGCISCHPPPLFTVNRTFTRYSTVERDRFALADMTGSSILDGVVLSHEESVFGSGAMTEWVDPRFLPAAERTARILGGRAFPLERSIENAIDGNPSVFAASTPNFSTFDYDFPRRIPRSLFSGRTLADEPGHMADADVTRTGSDGRNVNVPSLRNAWEAAPYLHHGRAATIADVLDPEAEFNYQRDPDTGALSRRPAVRHGAMESLRGRAADRLDLAAFIMSIE